MSYSFTLKIKDGKFEGGEAQHCPDGSFQVSGHVDPDGSHESLNITRRDSDDQSVAQAMSWHK